MFGENVVRDTVYFLVFDGFADWEAALALCEIRRPGNLEVKSVGFSMAMVESMGGLKVRPDITLAQVDASSAAMLILPGGHLWMRGGRDEAVDAVRQFHGYGVTVAGLSSAILVLARAGVFDRLGDTRNMPGFMDEYVVARPGKTATSGVGSVEFAREVIRALDLYSPVDTEHWYRLFKHAIAPPWFLPDLAETDAAVA
jgi:putative intracellular protease/amidase